MKLGVAGLSLALLTACQGCPGTNQPPLSAEPTNGAQGGDACMAAGAHMAKLGCRTARPDYVDWCAYELDHGVPLRPVCVSQAATCEDAEACR